MEGARGAFGRYELLDRVSSGGMAEVFRARDLDRGVIVALKRILPEIAEDAEFVEMFEDEARIASQLEHPYIARMLDYGAVGDAYFIAFEFVDGRDLRTLFDRATKRGQIVDMHVVLYVITRIAEGLSYAHGRRDASGSPVSIVHRDVSPQNIVVSFDGDVKLIDFGIAKAAGKLGRTQAGALKGKFGYMAPEQARAGGPPIDQRVDVFQLGICLWELLTMRRLFDAPNELLVLEKLRSFVIPRPSTVNAEIPSELDKIVLKALAKNADERYRSARDLYRDLNSLSQTLKAVATRDQIAQYMRRTFPEGRVPMATNGGELTTSGERGELRPDVWSTGLGGETDAKVQETSNMSGDTKGGSDLDIFEGLGKKISQRPSASTPVVSPAAHAPGPTPSSLAETAESPAVEIPVGKRTLVGMPAGGMTGSAPPPPPAAAAPGGAIPQPPTVTRSNMPPPPPGRGMLPPVVAPPPKTGMGHTPTYAMGSSPPPNISRSPASQMSPPSSSGAPATNAGSQSARPPQSAQPGKSTLSAPPVKNASLDMEWDDDDEATHIFDKERPGEEMLRTERPRPNAGAMAENAAPAAGLPGGTSRTLLGLAAPASSPPPSHLSPAAPGLTLPTPQTGFAPPQGGFPAHLSAHKQGMPDLPPIQAVQNSMEVTALVRPPTSGRMALYVALGAAGAALVGGALLLTAMPRPGSLRIDVSDDKGASVEKLEIAVDGRKQCDTTPCIVDQLSPGTHVVKIAAPGYESGSSTRDVVVEARTQTPLAISLTAVIPKKPTGLRVSGTQPGVRLFIDDRDIGALPQEVKDLEPGTHRIRLAGNERYAPAEKTVTIAKDETLDLGAQTLRVVKGKATISLATPGAKVYLISGADRRELPMLPIQVDIDTSKAWTLESTKAGMADFRQPISFDDGQAEKTFSVALEAKGAGAGGGAGVGAPTTAAPTPVAPSEPKAPAAVAAPKAPTPTPTPKAPSPVPAVETKAPAPVAAAETSAGEAFLNINSIPPSSVVLDGKPLGNTPRIKVSVKPGTHVVLFVNADEGLKKQVSVTLAAGETKAAIAKLRE